MTPIKYVGYTPDLHEKFIAFNEKAFHRGGATRYFNFRFIDNPHNNGDHKTIIALEDDEIIGQTCNFPTKIILDNQQYDASWEVDLIVLPQGRGKGIGKALIKGCTLLTNAFALGPSPISVDMHRNAGFMLAPGLRKFIILKKPLLTIHRLMQKGKTPYELTIPYTVVANKYIFTRLHEAPLIEKQQWNQNVIEFGRDREFLNWRFFGHYKHFYFYYNNNPSDPIYFVLKELQWENHCFLALVDYRVNAQNPSDINVLLSACKQLLKNSNAIGLIVGCSLPPIIKALQKKGFVEFELISTLFTNSELLLNPETKAQRAVFTTMADSDFEFAYQLKGHVLRRIFKGFLRQLVGIKK